MESKGFSSSSVIIGVSNIIIIILVAVRLVI